MTVNAATALIAEDEDVLREELRARLAGLWPELRVVAEAANGLEALHLLDQHRPAVVFLDIQMPGLTGLELAQQIQGRSHVVFVTAYDAHALAAFEQGAVDYVLKPYDNARLALTVRRLKERIGQAPASYEAVLRDLAAAMPPRDHLRWINASFGREVRLIMVDEVCYFQADHKYTRVVIAEGDALIGRTLRELQDQLDPAQFWTIHRSTIVNANSIVGVTRDLRGKVAVKLKQREEKLPVSEQHEHLFRQM